MLASLEVHFLPELTSPDELAGGTVAVADVLRASTTIVHALAAGARQVVPFQEPDEARQAAAGFPPGEALLGGERGGLPIEGFHLGNSPEEYTPASVGGRTVLFTTTNGTRALRLCGRAASVLAGAFVNFSAACRVLAGASRVHLLCAGTEGRITREDVLWAGAAVLRLEALAPGRWLPGDAARIAGDAWRAAAGADAADMPAARLAALLAQSLGGRNLHQLGLARDVEAAAALDRFQLVPVLDRARGCFVVA